MELIIYPTEACNFKCSFCMATEVPKSKNMTSDQVIDFYNRFNPSHIIVNGGDPLMMPPKFYEDILSVIQNGKTELALVTNLWGLYKNPEKWKDILTHKNVSVSTSFQYGNERRVAKDIVYSEELFREVLSVCSPILGYVPFFIATIGYENAGTMKQTVKLAKELGTKCRVNPLKKLGRCGYSYPLFLYYKELKTIYNSDLRSFEGNCLTIEKKEFDLRCPVAKECHQHLRTMTATTYASCPATIIHLDRVENLKLDLNKELESGKLEDKDLIKPLKSECYGCKLFDICNGCYSTRMDTEESIINKNYTLETYCSNMKRDALWIVS